MIPSILRLRCMLTHIRHQIVQDSACPQSPPNPLPYPPYAGATGMLMLTAPLDSVILFLLPPVTFTGERPSSQRTVG